MVRAAVDRLDIRPGHGAASRDLDDVLRASGLCRVDDVDLLRGRARVVPRDDKHALCACERLRHAGAIVELGNRDLCARAEHLACLVRIPNDRDRLLPEALELLDDRASRITRCANDRVHDNPPLEREALLAIFRSYASGWMLARHLPMAGPS